MFAEERLANLGNLEELEDWRSSPLGDPASWPMSLRAAAGLILSAKVPMVAVWGPEFASVCNDPFAAILGGKHPQALGQRFVSALPEISPEMGPLIDAAYRGQTTDRENLPIAVQRNGRDEQAWFNLSFSPIRDEDGQVAGAIGLAVETTEAVLAARQQAFRLKLETRLRGVASADTITAIAAEELGRTLGVARVGYGDIDAAQQHVIVAQDWTDGRLASVAGCHRLDAFGPIIIAELKAGRLMSVDDTRSDPRVGESAAAFAAIGTQAVLAVPRVKDGRFVAMLYLHHPDARQWTAWEVLLAEEVAERTWAAVERARAETAIKEREARLRAVWDQAAAGFARTDLSGRFVEVNERYCAIVGRTREALLTLRMQDLTHPDDLPTNLPLFEGVVRGGAPFELEKRYVRPDGAIVWARNSVSAIRSPSGAVEEILAVSVDLTDRRAAEARMLESEARFRGVFHSSLMGFTIFDSNSRETLAINDTFLEMTGHSRREFDSGGWDWRQFTVADYLPLDEMAIAEAQDRGWWHAYEKEYTRRDGTRFPVRLSSAPLPGQPGRVVVGVEDITEERAAKGALEASEMLARAQADELAGIYNAAPVGLCVLDTELRYVRINNRLAEINGLPVAEHIGRHVAEAVPDLADQIVKTMERVLGGEAVIGTEFSGETPAQPGIIRTWRENWLPLTDGHGAIVGATVSAEEITEAKAAEDALRESEDRFRNMADNAPVMMWVTDREARCEYLNKAWYEFTGQEPAKAQGLGWLDAVHPDDREWSGRTFLAANLDQKAFRLEYRLRRHDGAYRWAIDTASPRFGLGREFLGYIGSVIDINDRKMAEEALEKRVAEVLAGRKLLADIVEGTDAFIQVVDPEFRWLAINKAAADEFESIYGVRPTAGASMIELLADKPEHQAEVREVWGRALAGEAFTKVSELGDPALRRRCYEMKYNVLRDGRGRQVGAYQFAYDVTDRVQEQTRLAEAEAARREADALYRAYFENTPEALFVIGVEPDGGFVVEETNPAHEAGVGLKLEDIRGRRLEDVLPASVAERVIASYRQVVGAGQILQYRDEFDLTGELQHWDTSLVPMRDGDGRIVRLIGSSRNVTRQVLAEEALRQSQKMESMGQLTGGVAHDFNNLLTPIVGALDMLQRKGIGGEREQRLISGAAQSADRARILVQRLLAFARRQPLQPVEVDVAKLIAGMADLIASTTGPQIRVVVEAGVDLPTARADPNQLEMAVLNLAVNARDAMPEGGVLRLSVNAATVGAQNPAQLKAGRYLQLSVSDTGVGMDGATLARAVEPFFSTKGIGKGTGLGLSMVHGLAAQLGGAVTLRSTPGIGTNVELWLPEGEGREPISADADVEPQQLAGRGTVLLVDDEELIRLSTADMLSELGYRVLEACSAEEALALLNQGHRPDIVITDHLMPGMSGTDFARMLQRDRPSTRVLLVSGYADSEAIPADLPRLTKPFRNAELAASLAELI